MLLIVYLCINCFYLENNKERIKNLNVSRFLPPLFEVEYDNTKVYSYGLSWYLDYDKSELEIDDQKGVNECLNTMEQSESQYSRGNSCHALCDFLTKKCIYLVFLCYCIF